jgi:hypothetical protein
MEQIKIFSKLGLNDYIRLNFQISFTKVMYIIMSILGVLLVLIAGGLLMHDLIYPNHTGDHSSACFVFIYGLALVVYLPTAIYFRSRKIFSTNQRIQEEMMYEFSETGIKITGISFNSQYDWSKIFKIKRVNNILLLFQDKLVANIINLDTVNATDYNRLKELILSKKLNIKIKL